MKPVVSVAYYRARAHRPSPITDFDFRPSRFEDLKGACGGAPRCSFGAISRDYFNREARRSFVIEAVGFAVLTALTVPAIVDCVRALAEFSRVIGM